VQLVQRQQQDPPFTRRQSELRTRPATIAQRSHAPGTPRASIASRTRCEVCSASQPGRVLAEFATGVQGAFKRRGAACRPAPCGPGGQRGAPCSPPGPPSRCRPLGERSVGRARVDRGELAPTIA
jgi:hypothetical protein